MLYTIQYQHLIYVIRKRLKNISVEKLSIDLEFFVVKRRGQGRVKDFEE